MPVVQQPTAMLRTFSDSKAGGLSLSISATRSSLRSNMRSEPVRCKHKEQGSCDQDVVTVTDAVHPHLGQQVTKELVHSFAH